MNVSDAVVRLRIAVFGCLATVGVLGLWLAGVDGIRLNTPIVRTTLYCFLGALSMSALVWLIGTYGLAESASERTRGRYRFAADFLALVSIRHLFPLVMTLASYGLIPHSLTLADEWLSWPERMLGITHPVVYRTCEAWGLLPTLQFLYDSVWLQVIVMLVWFGLVRRHLVPLWEVTAAVSIAGSVGLVVLWLAPAVGPWSYYGSAAYGHPVPAAEAAFVADFLALREGSLTAINAAQGMVTIPSFHVVFAVLFAWTFRRERWVYPLAIALNAGVIVATFPVGWHYLTDLAAGGIWAAGTIAVVRRIQVAPAGHATASDVVSVAGSRGARGHHWAWSLEKLRSRESA
jgi:hypothetical protein